MKITILHYSVPPIVGGVESVIAHHARLMSEDGYSVHLIAARGEALSDQIPLTLIPLAGSQHPRVLSVKKQLDHGQVTSDFEALRDELISQLQIALSDSDILIAHNVCSLNKNLALTAALYKLHTAKKFPRLILWHHDLAWMTRRYRDELHSGYPWDLLRQAWPNALQVTVSKMRQEELAGLFQIQKDAISVITNGVDMAKFHKLEAQTQAYAKQIDIFHASPLLLLPVRITPRKNIELALYMLAYLRKDFPESAIIVTGPLGPHNASNVKYFEKLLALRKQLDLIPAAHFLAEITDEYIPDTVISDLYHLADALFLPSLEEGFGIPILEAGLAGIPVFCSDISPLRELGNGYVTYFSPDFKPQEVARIVSAHFGSSRTFELRRAAIENYTWEQVYSERIVPLLKI